MTLIGRAKVKTERMLKEEDDNGSDLYKFNFITYFYNIFINWFVFNNFDNLKTLYKLEVIQILIQNI